MFAYVNHARMRSWNQPVLSNDGKASCSRKQRGPLLGLELTTDRHPPTTSQTRYPLLETVEFRAQNIEVSLVSVNRSFIDLCCSLVVYLRSMRPCMANSKLRCHRRWQWPFPSLFLHTANPCQHPTSVQRSHKGMFYRTWTERGRPNTYHCDWWRDSNS